MGSQQTSSLQDELEAMDSVNANDFGSKLDGGVNGSDVSPGKGGKAPISAFTDSAMKQNTEQSHL